MKVIKVGINQKFKTINDCIKNISGNTLIKLTDDLYNEKVVIDKPNIIIDGLSKAKIIYNDYALKVHEDGFLYNTFRTYTCLIKSPNVTLKNLTIENNAGDGKNIGQAVALHLYGDNIKLYNCHLIAKQDTLFLGPLSDDLILRYIPILSSDEREYKAVFNHYLYNTTIEGTVDFIFGGSSALFKKCKIVSLKSNTFISAPNHKENVRYGFVFDRCKIIKDSNVLDDSVYLARPWRDYGFVTFKNCYLDSHIKSEGFSVWDNTNRHEHARFNEFYSKGPGKNNSKRVKWAKVV